MNLLQQLKKPVSHPLIFLSLFLGSHLCYLWESPNWFTLQTVLQFCILILGLSFSTTRLFALGMGVFFLFQISPYLWPTPTLPSSCLENSQHIQGIAKKPSFATKDAIYLQKVTFSCEGVEYRYLGAMVPLPKDQEVKGWYLGGEVIKLKHYTINRVDSNGIIATAKPRFRSYNQTQDQKQLDRSSFYYYLKNKASYFLSDEVNGLYQALSIANKELLLPEQKEAIQKLGLSHLFAISGMHIGILFLWLRFVLTRLLPLPKRIIEMGRHGFFFDIVSMLCIWFYIQLIGIPISALRSAEMLLWWVLMRRLFPYQPLWFILVGVANLILLLNPLYIANLSYQLSFISVFAIFLILDFLPEIHIRTKSWKRFFHPLYSSLIITSWVFIFLLPLTLNYFQGVSLLAIPSNLVHILVMSVFFLPLAEATLLLTLLIKPFENLDLEWYLYQPIEFVGGLWSSLLEANSLWMDTFMLGKTNWPWWMICFYWGGLILLRNYVLRQKLALEENQKANSED